MILDIVCLDEIYKPQYANDTDACMDLKVRIQEGAYWLQPGKSATFGTGVQVAVPKDHVMIMLPRSSTGIKLHIALANTAGIIDTGYRDEIKLCLHNFGTESVLIENGQRIAQFMIIPRPKITLNLVSDNEDFRKGDRGGGIGSTGV